MKKPALPSMPAPTYRNRSGRHVLSWLAALLALIALPCLAQPKFVYRFDTRPPEEIFSTGFTARGTNLDLRRYLSDARFIRSRGPSGNPGFIASTEYSAAALVVGEYTMARRGIARGYIYRIRADDHFYDLNLSVRNLREISRAAGCVEEANYCTDWLTDFFTDSTFISDRPIPASMIASVDVVDSAGMVNIVDHAVQLHHRMNLVVSQTIDNSHYIDADTHANPHPYLTVRTAAEASSSSCRTTAPRNDDDQNEGGAAGPSCEGDALAVAGSSGYLSPGLFPDCPPQKRSVESLPCVPPPVVNLSRLRRVLLILMASNELSPMGAGRPRDEL